MHRLQKGAGSRRKKKLSGRLIRATLGRSCSPIFGGISFKAFSSLEMPVQDRISSAFIDHAKCHETKYTRTKNVTIRRQEMNHQSRQLVLSLLCRLHPRTANCTGVRLIPSSRPGGDKRAVAQIHLLTISTVPDSFRPAERFHNRHPGRVFEPGSSVFGEITR